MALNDTDPIGDTPATEKKMKQKGKCPIWDTPATLYDTDRSSYGFTVDSPRAGGKYFIYKDDHPIITNCDDQTKARLTSILVEQRRWGTECPEISTATIEYAEQRSNLPIYERVDRLLECLKRKSKYIGEQIQHSEFNFHEWLCWSESINDAEVRFLIDYLIERGWILGDYNHQKVTVKGYVHLEKTRN